MSAIRTKLAALLAATVVAGTILWIAVAARERTRADIVLNSGDAAERLLVERGRAAPGTNALAERDASDLRLVREPIPPEDVRRLFTGNDSIFVWDPHTYYRFRGGMKRHLEFREHDGGAFDQATSEEGFIEDFARLPAQRDFLAVVAGDSHTEGLCSTRETFANRLEALLALKRPGRAVEVLNTGLTGYSFYNYLGVLEKLLPEKPNAFVVAFYGGNDFLDVVKVWHYFHHTTPPARGKEYQEKLQAAANVSGAAVANAFNQLLFFATYPEQIELALAGAEQACAEIQRLCAEHAVALAYVYIPPAFEPGSALEPTIARAAEALGLGPDALAQYDVLADRLIGWLAARGSDVLDLRKEFAQQRGRYYWSDLHINVAAHQRIAELLLPRMEAAWRARESR